MEHHLGGPRSLEFNGDPFITIGMAGYISRPGSGLEETTLRDAILGSICETERTQVRQWQADGCYAAISDISGRLDGEDIAQIRNLPANEERCGLIFGHISDRQLDARGMPLGVERILSSAGGSESAVYSEVDGAWVGFCWDAANRKARFFRDELGMFTLYVAEIGQALVFATDLRLIIRCMKVAPLDGQSVAEFLHYLYTPAPRTLVSGVQAVLPGSVLIVQNDGSLQSRITPSRFRTAKRLPPDTDVEALAKKYVPAFEDLLLTSVEECLPSKGSIGLTLSGGKDSSVLAVALKKLCPERVVALTIGQKDSVLDESADAANVCRYLGIRHHVCTPDDNELIEGLDGFLTAQDQPIGDPAALPYFLGMKFLCDECDVFLDGTGNDFYFGISSESRGEWMFRRRLLFQQNMPAIVWKSMLSVMSLLGGGAGRLANAWRRPIEEAFVAWDGWSIDELGQILGGDVSLSETEMWKLMTSLLHSSPMAAETNAICGVWEPHCPFRKAVSFAHSLGLQVKFPFTNRRLSEFIQKLPSELRHFGGVNKILVRKYMEENLPASIVQKPKSGFVFDLARVLKSNEVDIEGDVRGLDSLLDMDGQGRELMHKVAGSYREEGRHPDLEHRVYSAWLLARVIDANFKPG